jgi:hypothetical protein
MRWDLIDLVESTDNGGPDGGRQDSTSRVLENVERGLVDVDMQIFVDICRIYADICKYANICDNLQVLRRFDEDIFRLHADICR